MSKVRASEAVQVTACCGARPGATVAAEEEGEEAAQYVTKVLNNDPPAPRACSEHGIRVLFTPWKGELLYRTADGFQD